MTDGSLGHAASIVVRFALVLLVAMLAGHLVVRTTENFIAAILVAALVFMAGLYFAW